MPQLQAPPNSSEVPTPSRIITSNQSTQLRPRTFAVAIPLVIALCILSVYADNVSRVIQFGVLQLAPPALVALFGLALVNRALSRWTKS